MKVLLIRTNTHRGRTCMRESPSQTSTSRLWLAKYKASWQCTSQAACRAEMPTLVWKIVRYHLGSLAVCMQECRQTRGWQRQAVCRHLLVGRHTGRRIAAIHAALHGQASDATAPTGVSDGHQQAGTISTFCWHQCSCCRAGRWKMEPATRPDIGSAPLRPQSSTEAYAGTQLTEPKFVLESTGPPPLLTAGT